MQPSGKRVFMIFLSALFLTLLSTGTVSAQETGTLILYAESRGGDTSFSYSGVPNASSSFQIATELGGGARVFNLTAGTYTVTQAALPTNWMVEEVFCDGTGNCTVNQAQAKATFTIASFADVYYVRFTNYDSTVIPEFPAQAMMLILVAATSAIAAFAIKKHKKPAAIASAVLLSACVLIASTGTAMASPDKYIQIGTRNADEQIQFGTASRDVVVQLGFGSSDIQFAETVADDDWIIQNGGAGDDAMSAISGSGDDHILQDGGEGSDSMYAQGGGGNKTIVQRGGAGNDDLEVDGGSGGGLLTVGGGDGDDTIWVRGGQGIDNVSVDSGLGNDNVTYVVTGSVDSARIDGEDGSDFLAVLKNGQLNFRLLDGGGAVLYALGSGGSTITVVNVEHGKVVGDSSETLYQW